MKTAALCANRFCSMLRYCPVGMCMFSAFFRDLRTEFAGYNADKLLKDVMAGLTVCAVALPLALAFGVSSGASAAAGLVTAILAGVVIAILGGASYQVSGPTGAMSAVLIGIVGNTVTKEGKIPFLGTSSDAETILIKLSDLLSQHGVFFALVAGLALSGILASTMSTADSQLLTAASGVSQNLLQDFLKIKMSTAASMMAARLTVVGIAIVGVFLAWNPDSSVFTIVSFAWAGFGATFGPVVLMSLFWKRSNVTGAAFGMIAGGLTVILWDYIPLFGGATLAAQTGLYSLVPGFAINLVLMIIVSLLTKAPSREMLDEFDDVVRSKGMEISPKN